MILSRYLTKEVFKSQVAILFILLLIFFSQQLVRVLGSAVNGNVPTDVIFPLLGLGMPTMAQLMLPLCLFIAILLTFGRLYAESEITVMESCGVGAGLLVKVALGLSLFTAALAAYNAFWVSPWAVQKQADLVEEAKANPRVEALSEGQFMSSTNGEFVLFINKIADNQIHHLYMFQMKPRGEVKPAVLVAEKGQLTALPNGDQLLSLQNSQRFEGTALLPDVKVTHFDEYQAYLGYKPTDVDQNEARSQTISQLIHSDKPTAKAELQWRIALVLAVPLMALIAVPLSKVNPRQGRFAKMLPALLLYLIYFLAQSSLKSASGAGKLDATLFMNIVNVIFISLAILLNSWNTAFVSGLRYKLSKKAA
ncbi:MAG: LPS export ABC transporter permease LptF [Lonepinella koalarum]|nr:LPS export ABC transporter permease LptF [Lonepinella koalarum]